MTIKYVYALVIACFFTLIPLKLFLSLNNSNLGNSYLFFIPLFVVLAIISYISFKIDTKKVFYFKKNNPNVLLGILSLFITLGFVGCTFAFLTQTPDYDTGLNYKILGFFSGISVVSFILVAISHFLGKNFFNKLSFLSFIPAVYYIISLLLFLSLAKIQNMYEMLSQSFLTLFFVYYIRVFVNLSDKINIVKRLVLFSSCAFITTFLSRIVPIINGLSDSSLFFKLDFVSSITYLLCSIYAFLLTFVLFKDNIKAMTDSR